METQFHKKKSAIKKIRMSKVLYFVWLLICLRWVNNCHVGIRVFPHQNEWAVPKVHKDMMHVYVCESVTQMLKASDCSDLSCLALIKVWIIMRFLFLFSANSVSLFGSLRLLPVSLCSSVCLLLLPGLPGPWTAWASSPEPSSFPSTRRSWRQCVGMRAPGSTARSPCRKRSWRCVHLWAHWYFPAIS